MVATLDSTPSVASFLSLGAISDETAFTLNSLGDFSFPDLIEQTQHNRNTELLFRGLDQP